MLDGSGAIAAAGGSCVSQKEQQIIHHAIHILSDFNFFFLLAELGFERNLLLISSGSFEKKKKINTLKRYN